MQHSHTWKANSPSVDNEILCHYWIWRFITVFTRSHHWNLSWTTWIQSTPSIPHILEMLSDIEHKCHHTMWYKFTSVSEDCAAFIFRVERNFKSYILISSSYLCLWLLSNFFPLAFFYTTIMYAFLISISYTCSTQLSLLDFITPTVFVYSNGPCMDTKKTFPQYCCVAHVLEHVHWAIAQLYFEQICHIIKWPFA
jgi:hypothetical protein